MSWSRHHTSTEQAFCFSLSWVNFYSRQSRIRESQHFDEVWSTVNSYIYLLRGKLRTILVEFSHLHPCRLWVNSLLRQPRESRVRQHHREWLVLILPVFWEPALAPILNSILSNRVLEWVLGCTLMYLFQNWNLTFSWQEANQIWLVFSSKHGFAY